MTFHMAPTTSSRSATSTDKETSSPMIHSSPASSQEGVGGKTSFETTMNTSSAATGVRLGSDSNNHGVLFSSCILLIFGLGRLLPCLSRHSILDYPERYFLAAFWMGSVCFGLKTFYGLRLQLTPRLDLVADPKQRQQDQNSKIAMILFMLVCSGKAVLNFPEFDESMLYPQFQFIFAMIAMNFDHSCQEKLRLAMANLLIAIVSTPFDPLPVQASLPINHVDNSLQARLPSYIMSTLVYCILQLIFTSFASSPVVTRFAKRGLAELFSMHGARLAIVIIFFVKVYSQVCQMETHRRSPVQTIWYVSEISFLAAIGLAAVGAFRKSSEEKDRLRDELNMVGLALQASETAICVTDKDQRIIWWNPALGKLCGHLLEKNNSLNLRGQQLHNVLGLSNDDCITLSHAFLATDDPESEVTIGTAIFRAEVTTFHASQNDCLEQRFVVALKDVTEFRARQHAERAAERETLVVQAMKESMDTLTHELRTPCQGIMGICSMLRSDESLPDNVREPLDLIMASSNLLLVLINNLLDMRKCSSHSKSTFSHWCHLLFCPVSHISKCSVRFPQFSDGRNRTVRSARCCRNHRCSRFLSTFGYCFAS